MKARDTRTHAHILNGDMRDWERVEVVCWFAIFDSLIKETFVLHVHFVRMRESLCNQMPYLLFFHSLSSLSPSFSLWHLIPLCYLVRLIPFFCHVPCNSRYSLFLCPSSSFRRRSKIPKKIISLSVEPRWLENWTCVHTQTTLTRTHARTRTISQYNSNVHAQIESAEQEV